MLRRLTIFSLLLIAILQGTAHLEPLPNQMVPFGWVNAQNLGESLGLPMGKSTIDLLRHATVRVQTGEEKRYATGVLIAPDILLTAAHVVRRHLDLGLQPGGPQSGFAAGSISEELALPDFKILSLGSVQDVTEAVRKQASSSTSVVSQEHAASKLALTYQRPGQTILVQPSYGGARWALHQYNELERPRLLFIPDEAPLEELALSDLALLRVPQKSDDVAPPFIPLANDAELSASTSNRYVGLGFPAFTHRLKTNAALERFRTFFSFARKLEKEAVAWEKLQLQSPWIISPLERRMMHENKQLERDPEAATLHTAVDELLLKEHPAEFAESVALNKSVASYETITWLLEPIDDLLKAVGPRPFLSQREMEGLSWYLTQIARQPALMPTVKRFLAGRSDEKLNADLTGKQSNVSMSGGAQILANAYMAELLSFLSDLSLLRHTFLQKEIQVKGKLADIGAKMGETLAKNPWQWPPEANGTLALSVSPPGTRAIDWEWTKESATEKRAVMLHIDSTGGMSGGPVLTFVKTKGGAAVPRVFGIVTAKPQGAFEAFAVANKPSTIVTPSSNVLSLIARSKASHLAKQIRSH